MGRLICILASICGVFILSLMIVAFGDNMDQSENEKYVAKTIHNKKLKKE